MASKSSTSSGGIGPQDISRLANLFVGERPTDEDGQPVNIDEHLGVAYDDKVKDPKLFTPGERFLYGMFGPSKERVELETRKTQLAQAALHLAPHAMAHLEKMAAVPPTIGQMPQAVRDAAGIDPGLKTLQAQGPFLDFGGAPPGLAAGTARQANYLRGYQQPAAPDANGLSGERPAISAPAEALLRRTSGIEGPVSPDDIQRLMPETLPGQISQMAPPTAQVPDLGRAPLPHEKAAYALALPKAIAAHEQMMTPAEQESAIDIESGMPGGIRPPTSMRPTVFNAARERGLKAKTEAGKVDPVHFVTADDGSLVAINKKTLEPTTVQGVKMQEKNGSLSTLGKLVNELKQLPADDPRRPQYEQAITKEVSGHQLDSRIESLAQVKSKEKYGKVMPFAELADTDPLLAHQVREQAKMEEPKNIFTFQQDQIQKRQIENAPIIAEATTRASEGVKADIRMTGPTMIMQELTPLVDKLFVPEAAGSMARVTQAGKLRMDAADAQSDVTKWTRSIATAMRPQLARAEGEVGNLAAQEQLNAGELIPDPLGGTTSTFPFFKLPDTRETAIQRMKLATEFIELGAKAPNGERETSLVQQRLKGIKAQLNGLEQKKAEAYNKGEAPIGELSKAEFAVAQQLHAAGKSKAETEAAIRALRSTH